VASALQRIGRSGHGVGEVSTGTIYPFHGMDLILAAAAAQGVEERAVEETRPLSCPLDVLAHLGSLEIAAIAGVYLEGAELGMPMVCDGYPVTSGALAAVRIDPGVKAYLFAGHLSVEPGHAWQLRDLGLEPVFKLGLRLGEGTGAVLAMPVLRTACQILSGMKTFADVGLG